MLIATHIGVRESCRPMNQPAKAKAEIVAGASQIRIRKYSETASVKAGSGCAQSKATRKITPCKTSRNKAPPKARIKDLRIYATANDVFSIDNFPKGWDPEMGVTSYPITTSVLVGLSIKF